MSNTANLIASDHANNNGNDIRPSMNSYITPMMSSAPSSQQRDDGTHIWHHDGQKNIYATAYPVDFYGRVAGPAAGQPHIAGIASVPNSGSASGNIMGVYTPNGMEINHAADYGAASAAAGYQQFYPYSYAPHQTAMYPADMYQQMQNSMSYATGPPSSQHQQIAVAYNAAGTIVAIPSKNNAPTAGGGNGSASAAVVTNFGRNPSTNASQTVVQNQQSQQNSAVSQHQPSVNATVGSGSGNYAVAFGNHQQSHPNFYMNAYATAAAIPNGSVVAASGNCGDAVQAHPTSSKFLNNVNNVKCNNNNGSSCANSKLPIYENCSENYTERWVSSTVSIPPDMRLSPDNDNQHSSSVVIEGNGGFVPKNQPLQTLSTPNGWPSAQQDHRGNTQNVDELATSSAFNNANSGSNNDYGGGGVDQQRQRFVGKNLNLSQRQSGSAGFRGGISNVGNGRNNNGPVQRRSNGDNSSDAFGQNNRNLQSSHKNLVYSRDYPQTMGGGGAIGVVGVSNPASGLNECSTGSGSGTLMNSTSPTDYDGSKIAGGTSAATSTVGGATTWADMVKKSGNCSAGETRLCAPPMSNAASMGGVGVSPTRHGGTLDGAGTGENNAIASCLNNNTSVASAAIGSGRQTRYGNNVNSRGVSDRNKGKPPNRNYAASFNNTTNNGGKNFSSSTIGSGVSGSRMPPNFRNNNQSSNHISNNGSNEYNNSGNQRFGGGNNNNGSSANPAKNNNSGGGNYSQQKFAAHSAAKATDNDQLQVKADVNSGGKQRTSGKMYNSGSCGGATNQSGLLLVRGMNQQIHGMNQQQYGGNGTAINVIQPPVPPFSMFNNSMPPPFMNAIPVTSQSFSMSNNSGMKWNIVTTSTGDVTSQQGTMQYRNASTVGAASGGGHFQPSHQNVHHSVVVPTSVSGSDSTNGGHPHQIQQSQPPSFLIPFPQGSSGVPQPFYGILAGGPPPQLLAATGGAPFSVPFQALPPPVAAAMPPHMMQPFVLCAPPPLSPQEERFRNTWLDQDAVPFEQLNNERALCNYVVAHNNAVVMARDAKAKDPNAQIYCGTLLATTVQLFNNNKANHNCRVDPRGVALFLPEQHAGTPNHNQHYGQPHNRFGGSGRRNNQSHRLSTGIGSGGDRSFGGNNVKAAPRAGGVVRSRSVGAGGGSSEGFPQKQRHYSKKVDVGKAYSPDVFLVSAVEGDLQMALVDSNNVKKENESEMVKKDEEEKVGSQQVNPEDRQPESSTSADESTVTATTAATKKIAAVAIADDAVNDKSDGKEGDDDIVTGELKSKDNVSAAVEMKEDGKDK